MANNGSEYSSAKYVSVNTVEKDTSRAPQLLDPFAKPVSQKKALGLIVFNFLLVLLPMTAFSAAFLWLIYHNRVGHTPNSNSQLAFPSGRDEPGVFYVDISAATLVFIASWSSTIANTLTTCVVGLPGYPLAALLRQQYNRGRLGTGELEIIQAPRLCVLVSLLAGQKMKTIREYLQLTSKKHKRGNSLNFGVGGLVIALLLV